eukprot:jgi/Tetstr1/441288/TSEL_029539.t1
MQADLPLKMMQHDPMWSSTRGNTVLSALQEKAAVQSAAQITIPTPGPKLCFDLVSIGIHAGLPSFLIITWKTPLPRRSA